VGVGFDGQVRSVAVGREIGFGGAATLSVLLHDLHPAKAFHGRAVLIGARRVAGLNTGLDKRFAERVGRGVEAHVERAVLTVQRVLEVFVVLGALEQRQHLIIAPARIAQLGPAVEIQRMAAMVGHGVDRGTAAQGLAPWLITDPAVQP
jgi:hypothetical protein